MGSVVKAKVGEVEENTREGRIRRMRKDLMGCFQDVMGEKKLLAQSENMQKKEMIPCSIMFVCSKEEICLEMDEPISNLREK